MTSLRPERVRAGLALAARVVTGQAHLSPTQSEDLTRAVDRVLTHRYWGYPIFALVMWLVFQLTFTVGEYPKSLIAWLFEWLGQSVSALLPAGSLRGLVVDGMIHGAGGVLVFLPNILILLFGISLIEETGYMSRVAFIMEKMMRKLGLHGQSVVPALMGMGCNVPAIIAAQSLGTQRDRIKTILLVPLISCSARLPVYVLFAGALFPKNIAGTVVFLFQFVFGVVAFVAMSIVFKHTFFRGEDEPATVELPRYRRPTLRRVTLHMWHEARHYLKKVAGVVLVFSVLLWVLGAFPRNEVQEKEYERRIDRIEADRWLQHDERALQLQALRAEAASARIQYTFIGRIGTFIEPAMRPIGQDWRAAISLLTGFFAKEIVVSSMAVLYAVSDDAASEQRALHSKIAAHFTPLSGLAFMMFVLLYTPCLVALVTMVQALPSRRWSVFAVTYQLALAWSAAFVVYQGGLLLGLR